MINPIHRAQPVQVPFTDVLEPCRAIDHLRSTLSEGARKKKHPDFKQRALALLNKVWELFKIYLLFFLFDKQQIDREKFSKQLSSFSDSYFLRAGKNISGRAIQVLKTDFRDLHPKLKKMIKVEILGVCKAEYPNKSDSFCKKQVDEFIRNPFKVIEKEGEEKNIHVLGKALLLTRDQLDGFTDS